MKDSASSLAKLKRHPSDVGSSEVQTGLLTHRIEALSKHLAAHANDKHCKRGLLRLVRHREQLLSYLKTDKPDRYKLTLSELGLRK